MNNHKKTLTLFSISLILSFTFWRSWTNLFYSETKVSILRNATGLNIHHYHYGILLVLIATLLLIFHKRSNTAIILSGLGFGTYFDGFLSRLFTQTARTVEIFNYNKNLFPTTILFLGILIITLVTYIITERYKK
jgi:hypothetical protein